MVVHVAILLHHAGQHSVALALRLCLHGLFGMHVESLLLSGTAWCNTHRTALLVRRRSPRPDMLAHGCSLHFTLACNRWPSALCPANPSAGPPAPPPPPHLRQRVSRQRAQHRGAVEEHVRWLEDPAPAVVHQPAFPLHKRLRDGSYILQGPGGEAGVERRI